MKYFTKTSIGFSHIKNDKRCQDYSACYHDEERTIVTSCDGHGGDLYIRSDLGSKYASDAIIDVFRALKKAAFSKCTKDEICEKIKLNVLCEWNGLVEKSVSKKPFLKRETEGLKDSDIFRLKMNFARAYGTTLNGAMVLGNKLICINLGDGGLFTFRRGQLDPVFIEDDETVANVTYSMCEEDAFSHLRLKIIDFTEVDGVLLCTDGVLNPYCNLANFNESFVKPVVATMIAERYTQTEEFIVDLGRRIGFGDDVSLGMIVKDKISLKYYGNERRSNEIS